ncbi:MULTISPECIES: serine hydrolase domain-containing protein [Thiomicrorhabdus]|uniref:Serine hydrolase n=1 Tax=Thiomicrorhabdus heinhorstiae TaxID=2748010 RepID=A0ABS0BT40_9GAMM|nr:MULTISPECIES: serine hydrolase [Thiomicrorhabdus]MBF6057013.1 serine hydrolase [Thiomicrorhabdus heinhorstiae]
MKFGIHQLTPVVNFVSKIPFFAAFVIALLSLNGCGGEPIGSTPGTDLTVEQQLTAELDQVQSDRDFTLLVESNNGTQYVYNRGSSTPETVYRSASTSKMVTSAIILSLVQDGILSLEDHPQDYLDFWPTSGSHADITLRQLLDFTSGITQEDICMNNPFADFASCVEKILNQNSTIPVPGSEFYYSGTHMQVAALMAIRAGGFADWQEVFNFFKSQTQLFPNATYDLPSAGNPRVAGGMHWQANEYLDFLKALYLGDILSPTLLTEMTLDQISAASIAYSPIESWSPQKDWHYGLGLWIECDTVPFNCPSTTRVSSAGAYGAYPFMDFANQYFGIVALEAPLGNSEEGYLIWNPVKTELSQWAESNAN